MLTEEKKRRAAVLYRNLEKFAAASNLENAILVFTHRSGDSGVIGTSNKLSSNADSTHEKIYKPLLNHIVEVLKHFAKDGLATELIMRDGKIIDPQEN